MGYFSPSWLAVLRFTSVDKHPIRKPSRLCDNRWLEFVGGMRSDPINLAARRSGEPDFRCSNLLQC